MKRSDLVTLFQPFADKLAAELAELATEHINGLLEQARSFAIEKLRVQLGGKEDAKADDSQTGRGASDAARAPVPKRTGRRQARPHDRQLGASADRSDCGSDRPSKGRQACRKCGAVGHNAKTCGREPAQPPLKVVRSHVDEAPDWTAQQVEDDRREENFSISMATALRKA